MTTDPKVTTVSKRKPIEERITTAETRAIEAKRAAQIAQQRVNALKREAGKAERKRRTRTLIQMGAELHAVGLHDAAEVGRFLTALKAWTYTDKNSGERLPILNDLLLKART